MLNSFYITFVNYNIIDVNNVDHLKEKTYIIHVDYKRSHPTASAAEWMNWFKEQRWSLTRWATCSFAF